MIFIAHGKGRMPWDSHEGPRNPRIGGEPWQLSRKEYLERLRKKPDSKPGKNLMTFHQIQKQEIVQEFNRDWEEKLRQHQKELGRKPEQFKPNPEPSYLHFLIGHVREANAKKPVPNYSMLEDSIRQYLRSVESKGETKAEPRGNMSSLMRKQVKRAGSTSSELREVLGRDATARKN